MDSGLNLENVSILIVDDNSFMRKILKNVLRAFRCKKIVEAKDGTAALEAIHSSGRFDIVFTDWTMPGCNGIELIEKIRQAQGGDNPFVPIIMVSDRSETNDVALARDSGVTEFLVKPVTAKALTDRLSRVIFKPRPFVRSKSFFGPDRRRKDDNFPPPDKRDQPPVQDA